MSVLFAAGLFIVAVEDSQGLPTHAAWSSCDVEFSPVISLDEDVEA